VTEEWAQLAMAALSGRGTKIPSEGFPDSLSALLAAFETGRVSPETLLRALGEDFGLEVIAPLPERVDTGLLQWVDREFARRRKVLPLSCGDGVLTVAIADPWDIFQSLEILLKRR